MFKFCLLPSVYFLAQQCPLGRLESEMIDWARVSELRDEVGAEDFDEVVELFLEEVDEAIAALRDLTDLSDWNAMPFFKRQRTEYRVP